MNIRSLTNLQNSIVVTATGGIEGEWNTAVINIEIEDHEDGSIGKNSLALSYRFVKNIWKSDGFIMPHKCFELFRLLRGFSDGQKWSICTLEFDSEGRYEFSFSYEQPKRLNGIHDDESMLKNYKPKKF
jgi:hypothetical protein